MSRMVVRIGDKPIRFKESDLWNAKDMKRSGFPFIGELECGQYRVRGIDGDKSSADFLILTLNGLRVVRPK